MAYRTLAMNDKGELSWCTCPPELRGHGRCNHVDHQMDGESMDDFINRIDEKRDELLRMADEKWQDPDSVGDFIPYEGTDVELKPYRMSEEERESLFRIENRMQLDQNIDGGYMELEEPLWNDMDRNYFSQLSGIPAKRVQRVLYGEASIVLNGAGRDNLVGRVVNNETLAEWEENGFPRGWPEGVRFGTGVSAMNEFARDQYDFEATRYVYVLPYYMRMGIKQHNYTESSSAEDAPVGDLDAVSSDITLTYKYMLRNHAHPERQQMAYDALLNNYALDSDHARYQRGYKIKSLADEFAGKGGIFRAVLSGTSIPYSGRAVITPNADLKFGEAAIPASMAVDIFRPSILDELAVKRRMSVEEIDDWIARYRMPQHLIKPEYKAELEEIIADKRIALNRQPSLHQSSFQSFRPRISHGATVEIHPIICKAYNGDFDGDEMSVYGFNSQSIISVVDRSIDASLPVNIRLPRAQDVLSIMPTKDGLFGLLNILERRSDK